MSENKADPLREALKPLAAISLWRDKYQDGPDMLTNDKLARYFTADQVRAARAALAAPQPAAPNPNNLPDTWEYQAETNCVVCSGCMFRYGAEHTDSDGKWTCPNCGDGNGNQSAKPAAPLGGREMQLAKLLKEARQYVSDSGDDEDGECRQLSDELCGEIDAILAAIPQERGVERDGEAGTYDDDRITHASTYDEGITYAIVQLAELTGSKDWQIRDGSEDHATDVQDTIMDVLKCAGLYDDETGKLATIATSTANVVAGTDRAAIIEECALRLDESAAYEDRHIEAIKKDPGLSETGRESLIEHAITRRTAFRQGALSIRYLPRHGKEAGR